MNVTTTLLGVLGVFQVNVTTTLLGILGFFLFIIGFILILAGVGIITIKQYVEITRGIKALIAGIAITLLGALLLFPEARASLLSSPTATPIADIGTSLTSPTLPTTQSDPSIPTAESFTIVATTSVQPLPQPTIPIPQTTQQQATPLIAPTPTPLILGTITVPGNSSEGYKFTATQAGQYIFTYVSGAYSTYPEGAIPSEQATWLTAVRIFKNRPIEWDGIGLSGSDDVRVADFGWQATANEAESKAQGQRAVISLLQGDYLILVTVDEKPHYSDNPGEIVFEVLFTPTQ